MDYANIFCHLPIALPIGTNFLTEQNYKIERISDLVVVIKKLTKTTEDATFRRMTEVAGTTSRTGDSADFRLFALLRQAAHVAGHDRQEASSVTVAPGGLHFFLDFATLPPSGVPSHVILLFRRIA